MTIKEIDEKLEEGQSLKAIAQAYSEIANLKIKAIRSQVERNRVFFQEISKVYGLVRTLALKKALGIKKSKKTVCILITSNYHFYGSINSDLIEFFIQKTQNLSLDRIIIGKTALDFLKASNVFNTYQPFLLKQDLPDPQELQSLTDLIKDFSQVLVVHSQLKSLLVQEPIVTDITLSENPELTTKQKSTAFIFEPELPKILSFFDSQILTLLLEATFLEAELSRTASRFISMDSAETASIKFIKEYQKLKAFTKRNLANNKILDNYASLIAVRKGDNYESS